MFPLLRVRTLERKLEAKMIKEESHFYDLESVVQQVEQNLELMTVRRGLCSGVVGRGQEAAETALAAVARVHSWTLSLSPC